MRMDQLLMMLGLVVKSEVYFNIDGLWRILHEEMKDEYHENRKKFDADVLDLLNGGFLEMKNGDIFLSDTGKRKLRNNPSLMFIKNKLAVLGD